MAKNTNNVEEIENKVNKKVEKKIQIRIPKDEINHSKVVVVVLNGDKYELERGETIEVSPAIVEILERAEII